MFLSSTATRFRQGFAEAVSNLKSGSKVPTLAARAALSAVIAVLIALFLHADQPYWAGISAAVVMFADSGATIQRVILRVFGTIIGAIVAYVLASLFIQSHPIFYAAIFLVAVIGIYMSTISEDHMYAWLLGYITTLMVLFYGLTNPTPGTFAHVAFYRAFEITLGVLVASVVQRLWAVNISTEHFEKDLQESTKQLETFFQHYQAGIQNPERFSQEKFDEQATESLAQIQKTLASWKSSRFDTRKLKASDWCHQPLLNAVHNSIELMATIAPELPNYPFKIINSLKAETTQFTQQVQSLLTELTALTQGKSTKPKLKEQIEQCICAWNALKESILEIRKGNTIHQVSIEEMDVFYSSLMSLRLIILEIRAALFETSEKPQKAQKPCRFLTRVLHYDTYFLKHAVVGGLAILIAPMIWMWFALPGLAQIMVSVAAVIGMDPENTRYKAFLRIFGCAIGVVIVLFILFLSIENTFMMFVAIFVGMFLLLLLHYSNANVSYAGTQAAVVVLMGSIGSFAPITDLNAGLDRLIGISGGIICVVIFQHFLWRYRDRDKLLHNARQVQLHMLGLWRGLSKCLDSNAQNLHSVDLAAVRKALKTLNSPGDNEQLNQIAHAIYGNQRQLLRWIYTLSVTNEHLVQHDDLLKIAPSLPKILEQVSERVITRTLSDEERAQTIQDLQQIEGELAQLRIDIREQRLGDGKAYISVIEVVVMTYALRQICRDKAESLRLYRQASRTDSAQQAH